jgi:cytochrome o ubiquinol oxidase operon protein cyoD
MDNTPGFGTELRSYLLGFLLALTLTVIPFALTAWGDLSFSGMLWVIGSCGIVQAIVHFRFFLHIDLSRQKREDLHLILFTILLLTIMVGGTIWIMANLAVRMG